MGHPSHTPEVAARTPRHLLHGRMLAALVASDRSADALFRDALATPGATAYPFDLALVHLLYGEHLRRTSSPSRALDQLLVARRVFADLRADLWTHLADVELRATRVGSPTAPLTPQEMEIALLAASGLTNKQIAQQRFLSPRTVGAHLYRIFPKLGITSRAALRDALSAMEPVTDHERPSRPKQSFD